MTQNIEKILIELYDLEPGFRDHEKELRVILTEIIKTQPLVRIDQTFRNELRAKLMRTAGGKEPLAAEDARGIYRSKLRLFRPRWLAASLALVGITAAVVVVLINQTGVNDINSSGTGIASGKLKIAKTGQEAFGDFSLLNLTSPTVPESGRGGGGAMALVTKDTSQTDEASDSSGVAVPDIMPIPESINYRYVYQGAPLQIQDAKMDVLRRQSGQTAGSDIIKTLSSLGFGLVNLPSFKDLQLQNFTMKQSGDNGYNVDVSLMSGSIIISQVWDQATDSKCAGDDCLEQRAVTAGDIPSDDTLIGIANSFLQDHAISRQAYGTPEIMKTWMTGNVKEVGYLPDTVQALYPLVIDGRKVYSASGEQLGLWVSINILNQRVTSVANLQAQQYQSSSYAAQTDVNAVLALAQKGGLYSYESADSAKTVDVTLGAPALGFVSVSTYQDSQYQEFLVPAYIFPVQNAPEEIAYKKQVIVPLVKEFFSLGDDGQVIGSDTPSSSPVEIQPAPIK
ncbi:MAG: hypothetical protein WCV50_01065 [Patescibacteria group bacterium]|jgi:hypothetical protein